LEIEEEIESLVTAPKEQKVKKEIEEEEVELKTKAGKNIFR